MRVLMTADAVGGVWTYALDLSRALAPRGVQVTLAVMGPAPSPEARRAARKVPGLRLVHRPYRLEWMQDPWDDVAAAGDWLLALEREHAPDVVHLNGYAHAALPFRAPVLVAAHSCVLSWWEAVHGEPAPDEWSRYRKAVEQGVGAADAVLAPTRGMLRALRRHYGPLPQAHVVPNGRDPAAFRARRKAPFVLAVGRLWDKAKNVGALDAVAPSLPWPVLVAGDAAGPDGSRAAATGARVLGRLTARALAARYGRAAVFAHPARYEPFGLAPLEAAHSGCALVLGDLPTLREVWGDAALYAAPDDHEALRIALARLAEDADARVALARRATARAARFTPDRMAAGHAAVYSQLAPAAAEAAPEVEPTCAS